MPKHNNVIPNVHFHKAWERHVKLWFNQAAKKQIRRHKRNAKAAAIFPRPAAGLLRPVVHSQTRRYNMKLREGRGFTLDELKAAGVSRREALHIGISVDHRRRNKSEGSLQDNVQRLKAYMAKLVVFPRRDKASHRRDVRFWAKKQGKEAPSFQQPAANQHKGPILPIKQTKVTSITRKITDKERKAPPAYFALRQARADARLVGIKKKKASEKAATPGVIAK